MDAQNLQAASTYVNNLLLSRGLLRNGTPIEFVEATKGHSGANATMAQVINIIHDLILRRDRETDTLSALSQNLQVLRSTTAQQTHALDRLQTRNMELDRQLAISVAQERAAKASLKGAETRNRALREDMGRLKTIVTQIRGQCANDVRKRDAEIQRLKRHLDGRRGREGNNGPVGVVVISPMVTKNRVPSDPSHSGVETRSPPFSLRDETTEYLTQLSRKLSDENEALACLVKNTLVALRDLQGLPEALISSSEDGVIGSDPYVSLIIAPSYQKLAASMDDTLEHLRNLLTSPSFVPLEEVEIREDEIARLRDGWEKMEIRWREAITLMNGWRKRMMETGDTINLEDLRKGLNLAVEEVSDPDPNHGDVTRNHKSIGESSVIEANDKTKEQNELFEDQPSPITRSNKPAAHPISNGAGSFPDSQILRAASGNARRLSSPQKEIPHKIEADSPDPLGSLGINDEASLLNFADLTPAKKALSARRYSPQKNEKPSPPLTVQQKLEKAQLEAEQARKRADGMRKSKTSIPRKTQSKSGRRRSTLSPEELEALMGFI